MTDFTEIQVIYMGRRLTADNKTAQAFITPAQLSALGGDDLTRASAAERASSLFKTHPDFRVIGGIYDVKGELNEHGRVVRMSQGAAKWDDAAVEVAQATAEQWVTRDRTDALQAAAAAAHAKAAQQTDALDRLHRHYVALPPNRRNAFKVMVLEYLERGK